MSTSMPSENASLESKTRDDAISPDQGRPDAEKAAMSQTPHVFPEGGTNAWLVVLGCFCTMFTTFGIVNSFGIYQTFYQQSFLSNYSPSTISWIGSVQAFALFAATLISGPITDRHGPRVLLWPCSLLLVVAMMLTSLCTAYYQILLCQGILLGLSAGLVYMSSLSVVGHYFLKKRPLAMSLASTGSPLGGILYPIILNNLISEIGFAWAQRVCGLLTLLLLGVAAIVVRPTGMRRSGRFIRLEAFKKPAYSLQVAALFMLMFGLWTPYFYLADYGLAHGMSASLAGYLFTLLNAGSFLGRLTGGFLATRFGQFNVITGACYCAAVLLYCWMAISSSAGLVVLAVLYGAASGLIIGLMMSCIAHTADHPSNIGTYVGQTVFVVGFAVLGGAPITGALINNYGDYTQGILFSATVFMGGAILITGARYCFAKGKLIA